MLLGKSSARSSRPAKIRGWSAASCSSPAPWILAASRRQLSRRRRHRRCGRGRDGARRQRQLGADGGRTEGLSRRCRHRRHRRRNRDQRVGRDRTMQLARVIGDVVATRKDESLVGAQAADCAAADARARAGGPAAGRRRCRRRRRRRRSCSSCAARKRAFPFYPVEPPVDAGIVGIVDHWDLEREIAE